MFATNFDRFACPGDTITCTVGAFELTATLYRDDTTDRPDERHDGFWPSLNADSAGYIGPKSHRTLARHTARAKAIMNAWLNDEWFYCGVAVTVEKNGIALNRRYDNALWGIECNYPTTNKAHPNAYLLYVANDLIHEALAEAETNLAKLAADE